MLCLKDLFCAQFYGCISSYNISYCNSQTRHINNDKHEHIHLGAFMIMCAFYHVKYKSGTYVSDCVNVIISTKVCLESCPRWIDSVNML